MCEWAPTTDLIQAIGAIAQVATAIVAIWLAWRANRISHGSIFASRVLDDLLRARAEGAEVKRLYKQLFDGFATTDAKLRARTEWLQLRESVSETLDGCADVLKDEVRPARDAWDAVEELEHPHATGSALTCPQPDAETAFAEYETAVGVFRAAVGSSIRAIRQEK